MMIVFNRPGDMSLLPAIRALLRNISDIKLVSPDPRNGRTALMCAVEKEEGVYECRSDSSCQNVSVHDIFVLIYDILIF